MYEEIWMFDSCVHMHQGWALAIQYHPRANVVIVEDFEAFSHTKMARRDETVVLCLMKHRLSLLGVIYIYP